MTAPRYGDPGPDDPGRTDRDSGDPGRIDAVRDLLRRSAYSDAGISAIGVEPGLGVRSPDIPILLRALEPVEPLATLVRMFLLGQDVEYSRLRSLVAADAEALAEAGLIRVDGDRAVPALRLTPWRGLILGHDPDPGGALWDSHVSGPTPAADTLLQLVVPDGGTALDVGTGCGLLALVVAPGVERVVATDVNPAALRFSALNVRLNDVANVETRAGSLFEPVSDQQFDLIVSNPPFVISPEFELVFRHSAYPRDEISREVVRSAAAHLAEGGFAHVLVNWVQPPGGAWLEVLRGWLDGTGCDAVCMLHGVEDPLSYAVRWNAREQHLRLDGYPETLDRWLGHFRSQSIEALGTGAVVLRRRSGANWIHGFELSGRAQGNAGGQIRAIVAAQDYMSRNPGDTDVLSTAFSLAAPHRLNQALVTKAGEYVVEPATIVLEEGLGAPVEVEPDLIPVLLRLDGSQLLRNIVAEVAEATGQDPVGLTGQALGLLRELLGRGFIVPGAIVP